MVIGVLVELSNKNIDKVFDYLVPKQLEDNIKVGIRVEVPFGRQTLEGFVLEIKDENSSNYELKEIISIKDSDIILNEELLELGKVMSKNTLATLISCYQVMLPKALKAKQGSVVNKKFDTYYRVNEEMVWVENNVLTDEVQNLIEQGVEFGGIILSYSSLLEEASEKKNPLAKDIIKKHLKEIKKNIERIKPILMLEKLNDDKSVPKIDNGNDKGGIGFQQIAIIQSLFNSIIELNRFMQLFSLELNGQKIEIENKNLDFYYQYEKICELNKDFTIYLKTKDYLTKKPYSNDKIRLFFDNNSYFLNGFVESKTDTSDHGTQYGGYLFRKRNSFGEYDYFLGCSKNTKLFREHLASSISEEDRSEFERFYYYQLKTQTIYNNYKNQNGESYEIDKQKLKDAILDATKECGLPFSYEREDTPTNYLKKIENENPSLFKLVISNENVMQLQLSIIKNLKTIFGKYVSKVPALKDVIDREYKLLKDFNDDIQTVSSNKIIYYAPVSQKELEELQNQKEDLKKDAKLYFFKIENKDLRDKSKRINKIGTDNLHTMYFKALMSENQYTFDIGAGMVFFREQNYTGKKIIHEKNKPIKNKTYGYTKKESVFEYDISKDKRYFEDKFFLHLSLSINYTKSSLKISDLNSKVNKFLYKTSFYLSERAQKAC